MLRETVTEEGEEQQWYEEGIQETFVQSHPKYGYRYIYLCGYISSYGLMFRVCMCVCA